jgi:hypothetical protein
MIKVFRDSGLAVQVRSIPGLLLFEFPTLLTLDAGSAVGGVRRKRR